MKKELNEGRVKKGGVNNPPKGERPPPPEGQSGRNKTKTKPLFSKRQELRGFIETDNGLESIHLIFENKEYRGAYLNDDLLDDETTFEEFLDTWGSIYYESIEDFKQGNKKFFQDWEESLFS